MADADKRREYSHIWARAQHEHYVEPEWCSKRLFDVEKFEGGILDPCCGFGRIPEAAKAAGYHAIGSDIEDRTNGKYMRGLDFLSCDFPREILIPQAGGECENIVCNPPFDLFPKFAMTALSWAPRKVAMIWLVRTLPAARWLRETPLTRILLLTPRPSMPPGHTITAGEKPGGGKQDFCWLIWDKQHIGPATIGWLHRDGAV